MKRIDNYTQEQWFLEWCNDLIKAGYIKKIIHGREVEPLQVYDGFKLIKNWTKTVFAGTKREKQKKMSKTITLLSDVTYKPDVIIMWADKARDIFFTPLEPIEKSTYFWAQNNGYWISPVEVKAPPGSGNKNSSDLSFRILQKWVYEKLGIFVNKCFNYPMAHIKDKKTKVFKRYKNPEPYLWMMTFTPERYFYTDKNMDAKKISNWDPISLEQFLASKQKNPA